MSKPIVVIWQNGVNLFQDNTLSHKFNVTKPKTIHKQDDALRFRHNPQKMRSESFCQPKFLYLPVSFT